jgi:glycosyltransferase involved in cell wall biosynthesis
MPGRTALGSTLARKPLVLKLTSDPTFERSLRWGLTSPSLERFQRESGLRIGVLRRARDLELGRARRILVPSKAFAALAASWGVPEAKIEVLPNPVAAPAALGARDELRRRFGLEGPTLVYAGRLVPQKSLDVALEAIGLANGATLVLVGDGPERGRLEQRARELGVAGRARFLGARPHREIFELLRAADGALLSSSWENFPHVAVEALAVGTPVVATDVGGVAEIVRDGWNGLLIPPNDAAALAGAVRRYLDNRALQEQLRSRASESVASFAPDAVYGRLERILGGVA